MTLTANLIDRLATSGLPDWIASGSGNRTGIVITSTANTLFYSRSDIDINNTKAFQLEAVMSGSPLAADGTHGARMWARFRDSAMAPGRYYNVELRLTRQLGTYRFELVDGVTGLTKASLDKDWTTTGPRFRVRLKRQVVSGTDYMFLQAESSGAWDDPAAPNDLNDADSKSVPLTSFSTAVLTQEIGFGNFVSGTYYSEWEYVHATVGSDLATVLPYWPPSPPAPTLTHDDKGLNVPQGIDFDVDLSAAGYFATDAITPWLNANGADINQAKISDPSGGTGLHHFDFDNLNDDQSTRGWIVAEEVSGRSRTGPETTRAVPDRTAPDGDILIRPTGGTLEAPRPAYNAASDPDQIAIEVTEAHLDEANSTATINGGTPVPLSSLTKAGTRYLLDSPVWQEGINTIVVSLRDLTGNTNIGPISASFELDTVAPVGTIKISLDGGTNWEGPIAGKKYNTSVLVGVQLSNNSYDDLHFNDGVHSGPYPSYLEVDGVQHEIANTTFGYRLISATDDVLYWLTPLNVDGTYNASFFLQDLAGNSVQLSAVSIILDLTAPSGDIQVSVSGSGVWGPPASHYPTLPLDLGFAVPDSITDLDLAASFLEVQKNGNAPVRKYLNDAAITVVHDGSINRYVWASAITVEDNYVMRGQLFDTAANAGALLLHSASVGPKPSFFIDGGQYNTPDAASVSHTHDDSTDLDPAGLLLLGNNSDNFVGVRVSNAAGADPGDCMYRVFTIPAGLFVGTGQWRLISDGAPGTVANVAPGTAKDSTGNRNFNEAHPNFPGASDPLWATYGSGGILHTCTCAVLHSSDDPLLLPDGLGGTAPIADAEFTDPAQFIANVMSRIDTYTGATGSYWEAVRTNPKIANRNMSIKNVAV